MCTWIFSPALRLVIGVLTFGLFGAQHVAAQCGTLSSGPAAPGVSGGRDLPTYLGPIHGGDSVVINAVVVFVDFPDDTLLPNAKTWPLVYDTAEHPWQADVDWSPDNRPPHPDLMADIIDPLLTGPYYPTGKKWNITTYFREMSYGELNIIGHPIYVQAPHAWYSNSVPPGDTSYQGTYRADFAQVAYDALNSLDTLIKYGQRPNVFLNTDRWNRQQLHQVLPGQDNVIDLIIICTRNKPITSFAGIATLKGNTLGPRSLSLLFDDGTSDGAYVDENASGSGVYVQDLISYPRSGVMETVWHEIGHKFGLEHQYSDGMWSLMANRIEGFPMMNSFERWKLGWLTFTDVDPEVPGSLDGDTVHLCDIATYPQALRIKSPGSNHLFFLEHHAQNRSRYITSVPGASQPWGADANDRPIYDVVDEIGTTPGLFMIYDGYDEGFPDQGRLKVVTADGRWHWVKDGYIQPPFNPTQNLVLWKRGEPAYFLRGLDHFADTNLYKHTLWFRTDRERLDTTGFNAIDPGWEWIWGMRNPVTGGVINNGHGRHKGDGCDAWTMDWNRIWSPWSNPNTANEWDSVAPNFAIELIAQTDTTSSLKLHLTNPLAGPPSKPQDLRLSRVAVSFDYHQHRLTWASNREPDVDDDGMYYIWGAGPEANSTWRLLDSVSGGAATYDRTDTTFRDDMPYVYRYRITARDTQRLVSVYSDYVMYIGQQTSKMATSAAQKHRTSVAIDVSPNPAQSAVDIAFDLPDAGVVVLRVYDANGGEVARFAEEYREAGRNILRWNAGNVRPGTYTCVLLFKEWAFTRQIVVVR